MSDFTYVMSNDELASAIKDTHLLITKSTPSKDEIAILKDHFRELVGIQRERAEAVVIIQTQEDKG